MTILTVALILQEKMNWVQIGGTALIFVGIICASWEAKRLSLQKGDYLALAAALVFGLANANDRFILQQLPVYSYLVLAFLLPALVIILWKPQELRYLQTFLQPPLFAKMLLLNIFWAISAATFFAALSIAPNAAQVVMAGLTSVIVITGLSVVFLKERNHLWQKIIGAVVGFVGLMLLN